MIQPSPAALDTLPPPDPLVQAALQETLEQARDSAARLRVFLEQRYVEALQDPARATADWEAFKADMNAARAATGEQPLYP